MAREAITRTAPGWEERTVALLPAMARLADGAGEPVRLRPGFARLALLLESGGGPNGVGLRVWVQHSPDGMRWADLASFGDAAAAPDQVAWIEAQPEQPGSVAAWGDGQLGAGQVADGFVMSWLRVRWSCGGAIHTFGVDVVAIYERR